MQKRGTGRQSPPRSLRPRTVATLAVSVSQMYPFLLIHWRRSVVLVFEERFLCEEGPSL